MIRETGIGGLGEHITFPVCGLLAEAVMVRYGCYRERVGAGKSIAIQSFEDLGFYCVGNLPTTLIPTFANLIVQSKTERVALGTDVRERDFFDGVFQVLDESQQAGHRVEILFLEARGDVLVRRYIETRRRHPLAIDGLVSNFTVHDLRDVMQATYSAQDVKGGMHILVLSFEFKFGVPSNTDLVFDVRFLPNPHFDPDLRAYNGRDPRVAHYVFEAPVSQKFLEHLRQFLIYGSLAIALPVIIVTSRNTSDAVDREVSEHWPGELWCRCQPLPLSDVPMSGSQPCSIASWVTTSLWWIKLLGSPGIGTMEKPNGWGALFA